MQSSSEQDFAMSAKNLGTNVRPNPSLNADVPRAWAVPTQLVVG